MENLVLKMFKTIVVIWLEDTAPDDKWSASKLC